MISPRLAALLACLLGASASRADQYDTLRVKWVESLTGTGYDTADSDVASELNSVANSANSNWSSALFHRHAAERHSRAGGGCLRP